MKSIYSFIILLCLCVQTTFAQNVKEVDIALKYLQKNAKELNLSKDDFSDIEVTDNYKSAHNGIAHLYIVQKYEGRVVHNAISNLNILPDGRVLNFGNRFVSDLKEKIKTTTPQISAKTAVKAVIEYFKVPTDADFYLSESERTDEDEMTFTTENITKQPITAKLVYQPHSDGSVRLTWMIELYEKGGKNWWNARVDAITSEIVASDNRVVHCSFSSSKSICSEDHSHVHTIDTDTKTTAFADDVNNVYNVYPIFTNSPLDGVRQLEIAPADGNSSPFGWHDTNGVAGAEYTITRGNNVHVYQDFNNSNTSAGDEPDGGDSLYFDFPLVETGTNLPIKPAIVNLFYWNNIMHDVFYNYGFNEASGNFQVNNYGNGGIGNDAVIAEGQDGSEINFAFFAFTADGNPPRMTMTPWISDPFLLEPDKDVAFDNGVVAHEYAHGISSRLTGGPNSPLCVIGPETPSEGWSDWVSLVMATDADDNAEDPRAIGNYVLGNDNDGSGFRSDPYSTDMNINSLTYHDVIYEPWSDYDEPHKIGEVWCAMLWDLYWNLRDEYGFDEDIYAGTGGNNIAIQLVTDGMKLQPCEPTFIEARNAILAADLANYGGANQCLIWRTFARRGLGKNAQAGGTEDFFTGEECGTNEIAIAKTASPVADEDGIITYTLTISNHNQNDLEDYVITDILPPHTIYVEGSGSCNSTVDEGVLTIVIDNLPSLQSTECTYSLQVVEGNFTQTAGEIYEFEDSFTEWMPGAGLNLWSISSENPRNGSTSARTTELELEQAEQFLILAEPVQLSNDNPAFGFWHSYRFSSDLDGAAVEMKFDSQGDWIDMGNYMTANGYTGRISNISTTEWRGKKAFTGDSNGYIYTLIDLSDFASSTVQVRFRYSAVGDLGINYGRWYIDDAEMLANRTVVENVACVTNLDGNENCANAITTIYGSSTVSTQNATDNEQNIVLYPNPTTGEFTLQVLEITSKIVDIALYSIEGRLMKTDSFRSDELYMGDLAGFGAGVYLAKITTGDFSDVRKVVVQ